MKVSQADFHAAEKAAQDHAALNDWGELQDGFFAVTGSRTLVEAYALDPETEQARMVITVRQLPSCDYVDGFTGADDVTAGAFNDDAPNLKEFYGEEIATYLFNGLNNGYAAYFDLIKSYSTFN